MFSLFCGQAVQTELKNRPSLSLFIDVQFVLCTALQICQTGNLDRLHHHYQETLRYRQKLGFEIGQLEAQLMNRLRNRSITFPTVGFNVIHFLNMLEW